MGAILPLDMNDMTVIAQYALRNGFLIGNLSFCASLLPSMA
jgi:hypothetical protein